MDDRFISRAFHKYFKIVPADTEALRQEVYRIRYAVYCRELQYENENDFPDGLESDQYDPHSRHCLLYHRPSSRYAGCVRLVLANPTHPHSAFPFETACRGHLHTTEVDPSRLNRHSFGEISRLAVLGSFRRRKGEQNVPGGIIPPPQPAGDVERRVFPHIALGLDLAAASVGLLAGLDSVFAMMELRLARRLKHYGIVFRQVGEIVDHHGQRGPFQITREALFEHISPEISYVLEVIQSDLAVADGWFQDNPPSLRLG